MQKHIKALVELSPMTKENHEALHHLVDGILKHTKALKTIGRSVDTWDDIIIHLMIGKLDPTTNKEWKNSISGEYIPTLHQLIEFLEQRCHILEVINRRIQNLHTSVTSSKSTQARVASCDHKQGILSDV